MSRKEAAPRPYIPPEAPVRNRLISHAYDLSADPYRRPSNAPYVSRNFHIFKQRLPYLVTESLRRRVAGEYKLDIPDITISKSERLMPFAIAPILKLHAETTRNNALHVSTSGYPLPFWHQKQLRSLGIEIREFDFDQAIHNGDKLPSDIRSVYLDHPRTYGPLRSTAKLEQFIKLNPDVFFVIDQANSGFAANETDSEGTAQDLLLQSNLSESLLATTNSTSKRSGEIAVGWLYLSRRLANYIGYEQKAPIVVGFHEQSLNKAFTVLAEEDQAREWRRQLVENRHELAKQLSKIEGALPFGERNVPNLIIDATKLGYKDAEEMVDAFIKGNPERGTPPIAVKTCRPYADPDKHPEILNHVYIAVPVDKEVFKHLFQALALV